MQVAHRTLDGLVNERTHYAPNDYYFILVYDKVHSIYTNYGKCWWERCSLKEGGPSNVNVELFSTTGKYKLRASCLDLNVQVRGSVEANPILGVHIYLYSDDFTNVDCPKGSKNLPGDLGLG
ncbi:hypothetical protein T459_09201 [Capsicum annuum]|uniref:Uncharacterized protein n=1 Tax=Capsicum annuum TaxID=4072 RepID=A0A2G2ZYP8_CAPAN|nr:hypothetical protein FXO37_31628 [Capsicum annuum]PHT87095.1 hypothetical protein T459_09201 [Capsicum annuum]